jgi:hypothetical protein
MEAKVTLWFLHGYSSISYYESVNPEMDGHWIGWKLRDFFDYRIYIRIDIFDFLFAMLAFMILNNDNVSVIKDEMIIFKDRTRCLNVSTKIETKFCFYISDKYLDIDEEYSMGNKDLSKILEDIAQNGAKLMFELTLSQED